MELKIKLWLISLIRLHKKLQMLVMLDMNLVRILMVFFYVGRAVGIRPLADNGKDRSCVRIDGDGEDLGMPQLEELASLHPNNNNNNPASAASIDNITGDDGDAVKRAENSNKEGGALLQMFLL